MQFKPGQIIHHKLFDYRGVILKADEFFQLSDDWYEMMAKSKPPKNKPWHHVLVDNKSHITYVAEQNLEIDKTGLTVNHPMVPYYFIEPVNGVYIRTSNWDGDVPLPISQPGLS